MADDFKTSNCCEIGRRYIWADYGIGEWSFDADMKALNEDGTYYWDCVDVPFLEFCPWCGQPLANTRSAKALTSSETAPASSPINLASGFASANSGEDLASGFTPASSGEASGRATTPANSESVLNYSVAPGGHAIVEFWEGTAVDAYRSMCRQLNGELGFDDDPPFCIAIERIKAIQRIAIRASSSNDLACRTAPSESGNENE